MSHKVPKLKQKAEEEDDERVAVIDTGMFSVKVSLLYENVCTFICACMMHTVFACTIPYK